MEDVPDLLEFATAHLLELRYYDDLLDRELHRIYDELEGGGNPLTHVVTRKYRKLQRADRGAAAGALRDDRTP